MARHGLEQAIERHRRARDFELARLRLAGFEKSGDQVDDPPRVFLNAFKELQPRFLFRPSGQLFRHRLGVVHDDAEGGFHVVRQRRDQIHLEALLLFGGLGARFFLLRALREIAVQDGNTEEKRDTKKKVRSDRAQPFSLMEDEADVEQADDEKAQHDSRQALADRRQE